MDGLEKCIEYIEKLTSELNIEVENIRKYDCVLENDLSIHCDSSEHTNPFYRILTIRLKHGDEEYTYILLFHPTIKPKFEVDVDTSDPPDSFIDRLMKHMDCGKPLVFLIDSSSNFRG